VLNAQGTVFLLDVDNTLLDNDRFAADLTRKLDELFGHPARERYWSEFERLRAESGFADYLGALQRFRSGLDDDPNLLKISGFLLEYPFADLVFPEALAAIAHLRGFGRAVVLSDGDVVFQPRKIHRSGIWDAVGGDVLIYIHKEQVLDHVRARMPAQHYVMVDDKTRLLAAMKRSWGDRLTTVFVRQGHYARAPESNDVQPAPDRVIERIADLRTLQPHDFEVSA
jgi:FMN phosphatase YigB (HAD superfamily)